MYSIDYTHQFKKDLRKCAKRGLDIEAIKTAIKILSKTGTLPIASTTILLTQQNGLRYS